MNPSPPSSSVDRGGPRWRRFARATALALAVCAPLAVWGPGCLLGGFEQVGNAPPTDNDAGTDAGSDADVEPTCERVLIPEPPDPSTESAGDQGFVVAFRTIDLGESPASNPIGFDLDRTCSCQGEGLSCTPLGGEPGLDINDPFREGVGCDLGGGVDNAANSIFSIVRLASNGDFGSSFYSQQIERGAWSILLRVSGYNNSLNDPKVRLDWFIASDFIPPPDPPPDPSIPPAPAWEGADRWSVQSDNVMGGDVNAPAYSDELAYVADGVLVGAVPSLPIRLGDPGAANGGSPDDMGATMELTLSGAFIVAELGFVPPSTDFVITKGRVAGRIGLKDVFRGIGSYRDSDQQPYCKDSPFYGTAKSQLCAAADMHLIPAGRTVPCDALSLGIAFTAVKVQAIMDVAEPSLPPAASCDPGEDPAEDCCLKPGETICPVASP
ncbi:hypothetical protein [Chondromyces apiculatus]|uniref:Uncharacterized protein n=1 Tax=Chondromyces apiculatus DSM 436 TaxID=1192034 RepID=A0A017SVV4_9BACT|nr:hypothetical protein [Chondromyces apiculatus]EYF01098.1 Hypothetical protein CAP_8603 [Chondromyces apiculatus DSM 436]